MELNFEQFKAVGEKLKYFLLVLTLFSSAILTRADDYLSLREQTTRCNNILKTLKTGVKDIQCVVRQEENIWDVVAVEDVDFAIEEYDYDHISITTGLLSAFDDEGVAAILAHELGHFVQYRKSLFRKIAERFLDVIFFKRKNRDEKIDPYDDIGADKYAVKTLKRSGIPPEKLLIVLEKFCERRPDVDNGSRLEALKKLLAKQ